MKKLLFLCIACLLVACSTDDKTTITEVEVNLLIDHYKTTHLFHGTAFVINENGSEQEFEIPFISNFDFQPGFRYQATATRRSTFNNTSSKAIDTYHLIAVQSQDTIPPNTRFAIPLAKFVNGIGYVKWVVGNAELGYQLSHEIDIDCTSFCGELFSLLSIEDNITGEFEHGPNGTYILRALY